MASPSSTTIVISNASICYRRHGGFLFSRRRNDREAKEFWALRGISFSAHEGDTIGLVGRNGSGKSTCAKLISGALVPDSGNIKITGSTHLLALGAGFKTNLTGRENVMLSGTVLGLTRNQVKQQMPEIEAFADIGEFFDEPIKIYSSGMKSRLGFAVSTAVKPDILILDEVMSTGDASFRKKAGERLNKMKKNTKTVVMVSHSAHQIREQCNKIVWLEKGKVIMSGEVDEVMEQYEAFCDFPDNWMNNNDKL